MEKIAGEDQKHSAIVLIFFQNPIFKKFIKAMFDSISKQLNLRGFARHIFLCADQSEAKCCPKDAGLQSWNYLKSRLRELGLDGSRASIFRTKANCLRVCLRGPIAVIYPEATWYHSCTPHNLERIIASHLLKGEIVKDLLIAENRCIEKRRNSPL